MLIIETGAGRPDSQAFADIDFTRKHARGRLGLEAISDEGSCDEERLEKVLFAAAEYMFKIPWYGVQTNCHQALPWPRCLIEPEDYYVGEYVTPSRGWYPYGRGHNWHRYYVGPNVIPEEIKICNVLLANDIHLGNLDPTGFTKPTVVTGVSSEAGSLNFARPQALSNNGGMHVRTRDPLYAVRRLIRPWMHRKAPSARFVRA